MYIINRSIAIIKPKRPFLDWIRSLPDPDAQVTLEERNWKNFREWFDVEFHSVVIDSTGRPIREEEC